MGPPDHARPDPVEVLLRDPERVPCVRHIADLPARPGVYADWPTWADSRLVTGYRALGIERPWRHQVEAAQAAREGRPTVLATATGSGKSLAAWLPALTAVLGSSLGAGGSLGALRRRSTVMYLAPTKALAADQASSLASLVEHSQVTSQLRVSTCDGDTPLGERDWVRSHADVVLTNPDFLHFSLLPGHDRWSRLLRGLTYLVIDECHAYRGVFGAHVSLVLRRLLRLAQHYGATPVVIAASATTGAPEDGLARLIGVPPGDIAAVTETTAPSGRRRIVLWEPPVLGTGRRATDGGTQRSWGEQDEDGVTLPDDAPRRSVTRESVDLVTDLVTAKLRTLAFVRSRNGVEDVASGVQEKLGEPAAPSTDGDAVAQLAAGETLSMAAYRGGYLPEERRVLEGALREGRLLGLATTNALELGIDITGLDAVVMSGWPGTRVSFWQQAGRAGRAGGDGVAVLIAGSNPLDSYLVHHPEAIFERVEVTTFDPENPYVLAPHLCAAAAELPLTEADFSRFGRPTSALLPELVERGLLRKRPTGWYWNQAYPHPPTTLTDLRGSSGQRGVSIVEAASGRVLGTVDAGRADATVFPGAVYVHQGASFVVDELTSDAALVHSELVEHRTIPVSATSATLSTPSRRMSWGPVTWAVGPVQVSSQVQGYDIVKPPSLEVLGTVDLDMPRRTLNTTGVWWSIPADVLTDELGIAPGVIPGALHAAEHTAIGVLPLIATCDRWDIGGISTALHPDTGAPTVLVYDGYPGGAGFAERGFDAAAQWISDTYRAIATCECNAGCPRCIYSPKCGNGNNPLDKGAALVLLDYLRSLSALATAN